MSATVRLSRVEQAAIHTHDSGKDAPQFQHATSLQFNIDPVLYDSRRDNVDGRSASH